MSADRRRSGDRVIEEKTKTHRGDAEKAMIGGKCILSQGAFRERKGGPNGD
jgi:hypothetical protein